MNSKRLEAIASLVPKGSTLLDVGTDHAYLPIYLSKEKICKRILASDISKNSVQKAKENLKKYNVKNVIIYNADGLNGINEYYDTLTLSGMGTYTIIKILDKKNLPDNIIISSNNDLYTLRRYMQKIKYKIDKEITVLENGKYYDIIKYTKGKEYLSYFKLKYGKSKDKEYFKYLLNKEKFISSRVDFLNKVFLLKDIIYLKIKSI